jgi:hypothetical protein
MSTVFRRWLVAGGFLASTVLTACVSESKYEAKEAENAQLKQDLSAQSAQRSAAEA